MASQQARDAASPLLAQMRNQTPISPPPIEVLPRIDGDTKLQTLAEVYPAKKPNSKHPA